MKGLFITLEGLDGSGKTTQVNMLESYLRRAGYPLLVTREPGGTKLGEQIRSILLDVAHTDMDPVAEALMYAAARAQHVAKVIKPALLEGKIVLCDRFVDSSIAYQGFGRELGMDIVEEINHAALRGVGIDLTIFLNLSPEQGLKRSIAFKGNADRLEAERIEFHQRVQNGFYVLRERYPHRVKEIDAGGDVDDVFNRVVYHVNSLINNQK